jgi:hypothetical protein
LGGCLIVFLPSFASLRSVLLINPHSPGEPSTTNNKQQQTSCSVCRFIIVSCVCVQCFVYKFYRLFRFASLCSLVQAPFRPANRQQQTTTTNFLFGLSVHHHLLCLRPVFCVQVLQTPSLRSAPFIEHHFARRTLNRNNNIPVVCLLVCLFIISRCVCVQCFVHEMRRHHQHNRRRPRCYIAPLKVKKKKTSSVDAR